MEPLVIRLIRCLENPKSLGELERCAVPPYPSSKEMLLDLRLLKLLGIAREVDGVWSLTEKGRIVLRRVSRHG